MSITIHIPPEYEQAFRRAWGDGLDRAALEALAIEGYRAGKFGAATVRHLLNHESRWETEQWLAQRGVPLNYTLDDLQADRQSFERLFNKSA